MTVPGAFELMMMDGPNPVLLSTIIGCAFNPCGAGFVLGTAPGCVYPSISTVSEMVKSLNEALWITCGPAPGMLKWMTSVPDLALASSRAA